MSLATVRNRVNAFLTARWPAIVSRQDDYFANHGRYWQGLWTHTATPDQTSEDGDAPPDNLDSTPTDQPVSWRARWANALDSIPFPARLRIDVYESPEGHGWAATVQIRYGGKTYQRSQGVGPRAEDFTAGWARVD